MSYRDWVLTLLAGCCLPISASWADDAPKRATNEAKQPSLSQRLEAIRADAARYDVVAGEPKNVELTGGLLDQLGGQPKRAGGGTTETNFHSSRRSANATNTAPQRQTVQNPPQAAANEPAGQATTKGFRGAQPATGAQGRQGSGNFKNGLDGLRDSLVGPPAANSQGGKSIPSTLGKRVASRPIGAAAGDTVQEPSELTATDLEAAPAASGNIAAEPIESQEPRPLPSQDAQSNTATPSSNNSAETLLMALPGPQLSAIANGPKRIVVSRQAEYKVILKNSGDVAADGVVVSVQLPPWVEVVGSTPSQGATKMVDPEAMTRRIEWRIDRLTAGSHEQLSLLVIPRESKPINLGVQWNYLSAGSETEVIVEEPLLHMVITGPGEATFGETKLYNLTLSNPGSGDAENVVISLLPLGGSHEGKVTHALGMLKRGETKTIQVELAAGKAGTLLVKAIASAEGGLKAEASKDVLVRRADLVLNIMAEKAQYAGNQAVYKVRVSNPGNATAEDVAIDAILPPAARFVSGSHNASYSAEQGTVHWNLGALAAGGDRVLDLTCVLMNAGNNELRVTGQESTELSVDAHAMTMVIARADLKLLVSDPQGPVPVGHEAEYEIRIVNRGTKDAEGVEAIAYFSEGVEAVSVEGGPHEIGAGQVLLHSLPSIAAGEEVAYRIKAKASVAGDHVFRAEVLCRSLGTKHAAEETTHFYESSLASSEGDSPSDVPATLPQSSGDAGSNDAATTAPEPLVGERAEESTRQ